MSRLPISPVNIASVTATIQGLNNSPQVGRRVRAGLIAGANELLKEALLLVPFESGTLYASGRIEIDGFGIRTVVSVIFGNDSAPYAIYVHEDLTKAHGAAFNLKHAVDIARGHTLYGKPISSRRSLEQAKFLEAPLRNKISNIRDAFNRGMQ